MSEEEINLTTVCLRARVLVTKGDFETGLRLLNYVIENDPEHIMAYADRGTLYSLIKNYNSALNDLMKVLELGNQHATIYSNIGTILYELKKYEPALKYFEKAIELDSKNPLSYINRANIYEDIKEYPLAIKDFEICLMLNPDDDTKKRIYNRLEILREKFKTTLSRIK